MGFIPTETVLVPLIFTMPEGSGLLRLAQTEPITLDRLTLGSMRTGSDSSRWLTLLIQQRAPGLQLTSRVHPLLPRLIDGMRIAIPVWAVARVADPGADHGLVVGDDPVTGLRRLNAHLEDGSFDRSTLAAVRAALAADPFAQRVVGDDARLGALSDEPLTHDPREGLPAVVALLPPTFTLAELQSAIAATMGMASGGLELGGSFRRRLQEFVHRRVLREVLAPRESTDAERVGRPPRRYEFDLFAWRQWLMDQGARASARTARQSAPEANYSPPADASPATMRDDDEEYVSRDISMPRMFAADMQPPEPRTRSPREPRRASRAALEAMLQQAEDRGDRFAAGETMDERIRRLESMIEKLAGDVAKGKKPK